MAEIVYQLEALEKLDKELKYLQTHAVKVGILSDDGGEKRDRAKAKRKLMKKKGLIKKGGTGKKSDGNGKGATILEYAIFNEYGTGRGIPARPFFRLSVKTSKAQKEIKEYMKTQVELVIAGELTGEDAYNNLGNFLVQKIKTTIMSGNFKGLSSKTIKIRQKNGNNSTTPLVDTGSLINAISYEIVGA